MSDGNRRLGRPSQIEAVSPSRKPTIIEIVPITQNVIRYTGLASILHNRHGARPAAGGLRDFHREAGDLEAEGRELVQVGELLHVAIADLAAGLVAFPNEARIAGRGEAAFGE